MGIFKKNDPLANVPHQQYTLVERKIDDEHYRQGIRIDQGKYKNVIFTTSPKVNIIPDGDLIKLSFEYFIESNPNSIHIEHEEFEKVSGDILINIIDKNYKDQE